VFSITHAVGTDKTVLSSPDELVSTLRDRMGLEAPEAATLWPAICERHDKLFPQGA
jgi:N-hydroxyarylamine O-acetyltransferase